MSLFKQHSKMLIPIAVAIVCLSVFVILRNHFNIGGILGNLFEHKVPENRTTVVEERVDGSGNPIIPGQSDSTGFTQAPAMNNIDDPKFFGSQTTITVVHPTEGKQKIDLPTGVKNKDVGEITQIRPNVHEVKNNDRTDVDVDQLLGILGTSP